MYLLDTNIFLEILLEQEKAEESKALFLGISPIRLFISDFSLHSTGIFLFSRNQYEVYEQFVDDMLLSVGITVLRLNIDDIFSLGKTCKRFKLDFDDSYQYLIAIKYKLEIISFDKDFDRTEKGRRTPGEIEL